MFSLFSSNIFRHLFLQYFHGTARLKDDLVERPDVEAVAHLLLRLLPHLPDSYLAHLVTKGLPRPRDVPVHFLLGVTSRRGGMLHHVGDCLLARPPYWKGEQIFILPTYVDTPDSHNLPQCMNACIDDEPRGAKYLC